MTVEKPKPKQLLRPITTGTNGAMNRSQFLAITCNSLEAREKSRVHGAFGFGFAWLKNWRESFKPITKRSNRNHVITFDSHLKTALSTLFIIVIVLPSVMSSLFKMIAVIFADIVLFPPLRRHQGFNRVQITAKEMAFFFFSGERSLGQFQ